MIARINPTLDRADARAWAMRALLILAVMLLPFAAHAIDCASAR